MERSRLRFDRPSGGSWKYLSFAVGFVLLISAGYLLLPPYIHGSSARENTTRDRVGSDLALASRGGSPSSGGQGASTPFGRASASFIHSVAPMQFPDGTPFAQTDTLEYRRHRVQKGEGLWMIARSYGLSTHTVRTVNRKRLRKYDYLPVGLNLRIPNRDGVLVQLKPGQTLWDLKETYGVSTESILSFNQIASAKQVHRNQELFLPGARPRARDAASESRRFGWPTPRGQREISSPFGMRQHPIYDRRIKHQGIDIAGREGTRVLASRAGRVVFARRWSTYGRTIRVNHYDGFKTLYSHLDRIVVEEGQYVEKGQTIGVIGSSGLATGANLHFEIEKNGRTLDPTEKLP